MHLLWVILIGFVIGLIARWLSPSPNNPTGFIFTSVLGILGSVAGTFLGQFLHLYRPGQQAGLIGSIIGAIVLLVTFHALERATRY